MKAIVLHGRDGNFCYEKNWSSPEKPADWALVKVLYCGVCGSDIPRFSSTGSYHHPIILGHEFSGIVSEVSGSSFKVGDPVAAAPIIPCGKCAGCQEIGPFHCEHYQFLGSRNDGGFAEYCAVPLSNLIKLESVDVVKAGCLTEPLAVALHTVRRSGFKAGGNAIVFGAGPIGLLAGLCLRELGAQRVVMTDLRDRNIETAKKIGFEVTNPAVTDITKLGVFDYAYECAGSGKAINDAVAVLKGKGVLTIVGRDTKDTVIQRSVFEKLMRKELSFLGCWGYDIRGEEKLIANMLAKHKISLESIISHTVPVEDAEQIIRDMCAGKFEYCKVAVSF